MNTPGNPKVITEIAAANRDYRIGDIGGHECTYTCK